MVIVHLLDQLVILPVGALGFDDEIKKGGEVVLPMPHRLHRMDMIADPVFVHHHDLAVNKDERAFRRDRTPKLMQKKPEPRVQSGHHRGEAQLTVVVRAVVPSADVHGRKLVFKFDHTFISLLKFF